MHETVKAMPVAQLCPLWWRAFLSVLAVLSSWVPRSTAVAYAQNAEGHTVPASRAKPPDAVESPGDRTRGGVMQTVVTRPLTGQEYLESLRDAREIWIFGERV